MLRSRGYGYSLSFLKHHGPLGSRRKEQGDDARLFTTVIPGLDPGLHTKARHQQA